jgi:4-hydroxybutyryl-CoA dehydratase/vinylacetyl-CoA-Delta-isomerase
VTYDVDQAKGTEYHQRLINFLKHVQVEDLMCSSAITDAKGNRGLPPLKQADPDMYVHVVKQNKDGIIVRGAKVNQTGVVNSHEVIVMPTAAMGPEEKDYAISFAMPTSSQGIIYVLGRQSNDTRTLEGEIDQGNACYGVVGGEAMIIFNDLFVPWERVFLCGEYEFTGEIVNRFASLHRQRYGACKAGVSDVLIGATATLVDYHGISKASAIRDKLGEMVHLTETMYGCSLASALSAYRSPSGVYYVDPLRAAVTKQNVSRFTYELFRIAHDIAGGFIATMPSENDFKGLSIGKYIEKYYRAVETVPTEHRLRLGRLIENMTSVSAAVEATHGAGSPQAQRMTILRQADLEKKKKLALKLAGIKEEG